MGWAKTKNNKPILTKNIPEYTIDEFREKIIKEAIIGKRVVGFFGQDLKNQIKVFCILSDDEKSEILIASTIFKDKKKFNYQSITNEVPAFHLFERELYEEFCILPENHPWLKPVRYNTHRKNKDQKIENYPFYKIKSSEIHEVGVGPIHAGIIEPGHFRFLCYGEKILNLEIQLGYQHRGVENLFIDKNKDLNFKLHLSESITGDTVIGHGTAYVNLIESLSNTLITKKAKIIRAIFLEFERIGIHLGDLSALSNDVAYLTGSSVFAAKRTLIINTLLSICKNRFGRSLLALGGVNFDINRKKEDELKLFLSKIGKEIDIACDVLFSSGSVLSRFEKTGIIESDIAKIIGLVGPTARASDISIDIRSDHPFGIYKYLLFHKITYNTCDVFSRAIIRYAEIKQSLSFILKLLEDLSYSKDLFTKINKLDKNSFAVSMVEGWRGEIVHVGITDNNREIIRYKIKDPSFNNWMGLSLAVKNNGISDFPLCNKSFNLSYCGFDL